MAVSPARAAAFEILLRVERERSYAGELLHSARFAKLSSADHGLATELVMGVLRWRSLLDRRLVEVSSQKIERLDEEVLTALRLGAYQLQFLSRVPARAAIFESVELVKVARKRSASSFVNAVLRKLAGAATSSPATPQAAVHAAQNAFGEIAESSDTVSLARNSAHPEWLAERWVQHFGIDIARRICAHNQKPPVTSVRIHDAHSAGATIAEELAQSGIQLEPGHLLSAAHTVLGGDVTRTQAYKQGRLAIQDEASQLVALLAGRGERILDCCAAPGGKTALLARRNPTATVVAAELHPHRARLLRTLVDLPNVRVVAADACQLPFATRFNCILVDVPCSGTGTLARNPEIKWRLTVEDLDDLRVRQIAILKSALAQLAVGGRLVYSTCSLEREENEAVVEAALAGASQFSVVNCRGELEKLHTAGELGDVEIESLVAGSYLRTIPGVHPCDGFFGAIIEAGEERAM
jgi:16S rRNA (cytosine967-C5)-methyltransferase